jgi:hypothetical protein
MLAKEHRRRSFVAEIAAMDAISIHSPPHLIHRQLINPIYTFPVVSGVGNALHQSEALKIAISPGSFQSRSSCFNHRTSTSTTPSIHIYPEQ